jgi:sec-independent protein translocase protein TatA
MLGDLGFPELLLVLLIVVVLFGPGKLPEIGKGLGEAIRFFKKAINEPERPHESDKRP